MNKDNKQTYIPFTKKVNISGKEAIALANGTKMCRIHKDGSVTMKAPLFRALIMQLHQFESVYLEPDADQPTQ